VLFAGAGKKRYQEKNRQHSDGAMGRVREGWGGIPGHGQAQGAVGRHAGLWAGTGSGGEVYEAMGRVREWWGGIRGHGQGQGGMGSHARPWAGSGSGGEEEGYKNLARARGRYMGRCEGLGSKWGLYGAMKGARKQFFLMQKIFRPRD